MTGSVTAAASPPPAPMPPVASPRVPLLDPTTRRPTLVVAAVIAALFFGSQLVNEALPGGTQEVTEARTVTVGEAVTFTAVAGWQLTPHESGGGVRLEKGVVVLDVFPEDVSVGAPALAQAYLAQVLEADSSELTSTDIQPGVAASGTAARFRYQGIFTGVEGAIEGEVTSVVNAGNGAIADAWAPQGRLDSFIGEVRQMLATLEVRP